MNQLPLTPREKEALKIAEAALERERISRADRRHTAPGARGQECNAPAMRHRSLEPLTMMMGLHLMEPNEVVIYSEARSAIFTKRKR
jgi:hypothetical protein